MQSRNLAALFAFLAPFLAALCLTPSEALAWNEALYPDLKGQWRPIGDPGRFDPSKNPGLA
jgi:hypothetical protein